MHTIIYVSTANRLLSQEELIALLQKSQNNNKKCGITGLLLYHSGNFIQAMEGNDKEVKALYEIVRRDKAHRDIITLIDEAIPERNFSEWAMGFVNLHEQDLSNVEGFYDIFKEPVNENNLPIKASDARRLLFSFRKLVR